MTTKNQGLYRENGDKNGIIFAGVPIPKDVRHLFGGKTWLQKSTGTTNVDDANRIGSPLVEAFKRQIKEARRRVHPLTAEQTEEVVAEFIAAEKAHVQSRLATSSLGPEFVLAAERMKTRHLAKPNQKVSPPALVEGDYIDIGRDTDPAAEYLTIAMERLNIAPDHPSYAEVREAVRKARYGLAASNVGVAMVTPRPPPTLVVPFKDIIARWAKEKGYEKKKTKGQYEKAAGRFIAHLGHDNAAAVEDTDFVAWQDSMVDEGLSPALIGDQLGKVKTLYKFARNKVMLRHNPTAEIEYRAKADPSKRRRGYTEEEARKVLLAARKETKAPLRWAPWLSCFLGARIGEVTGATKSDVCEFEGIWSFRIDPANREEGETVKNDESIRLVPLHPALIAEGFLDYMKSLPDGALFPTLNPNKYGKRGARGSKVVGKWIREEVGLTDKNLPPSHGWRYRHEQVLAAAGVTKEHRYALQGHKVGDAGEGYKGKSLTGGFPMKLLYEETCKMPNPAA